MTTTTIERRPTRLPFAGATYLLVILPVGSNMPTALYGRYQETFGFSVIVQTAVFAFYVVGLIPSLMVFGPLSDRLGRRPVLATSVLVGALAAAVLLFASNTAMLLIGRLVQGVAVGAITAAGAAALLDYEPHRDPARAAVIATLSTASGAAFGSLFAASLAQYLPHPLALPYILYLIALALGAAALRVMPDTERRSGAFIQLPRVPAAIRVAFWQSALACALAWGSIGLFQSVGPAWITGLLGTGNLVIASSAAALSLVVSAFAQVFSRRFADGPVQSAGMATLTLGMLGLCVVNVAPSLALLLVVTAFVGTGHGLSFVGSMRELNAATYAHAPGEHGAAVAGLFAVGYVGLAVFALIAGIAITMQGMTAAIAELAAVMAVLCTALGVVRVGVTRRIVFRA